MVYDTKLAARIVKVLGDSPAIREQKMFGGVAYLLDGNMVCGIVRDELMVRVGPDAYEDSLAQPYARPMEFTGRPSRGMVFVSPPAFADAKGLRKWVDRGLKYAGTLPPK